MLQEESWPADIRWLLTDFQMSDEGAEHAYWTPRFILAQDNKIILSVTGLDGWNKQMLPKIREVTGSTV